MRTSSVPALLAIRTLLLANGVIVAVIGLICLLFVERPAGLLGAGGAWALSIVLFACIPLTDPYRRERLEKKRERELRQTAP